MGKAGVDLGGETSWGGFNLRGSLGGSVVGLDLGEHGVESSVVGGNIIDVFSDLRGVGGDRKHVVVFGGSLLVTGHETVELGVALAGLPALSQGLEEIISGDGGLALEV